VEACVPGHARPEDRRRAFDAGFDMHLPKPVGPDELVEAVADLSGAARTPSPSR